MADETIQKALNDSIQAAVVAALGGTDAIVRKMVAEILNEKVDKNGSPPRYSSEGTMSYLEWLTNSHIKEAVRMAFVRMLNEQTADLERMVTEQLQKESGGLAAALVTSLKKHIEISGQYSFNVNIRRDEDDYS